MTARLGLGDLIAALPRALSRYTGTLLAVFVVQSLIAAAAMTAIAIVLAQTFQHLPIFDDAVDGDLVSLIACVRYARPSLLAIGGIVVGALLLWQLASWFLVGGVIGVLAKRPEGRADTAATFGAAGATTYLAYARLALCQLPALALVLAVLSTGLTFAAPRIEHALTMWELVAPLAIALAPAAALLLVAWTIGDYARVELSLRHASHAPGVIATYVRTLVFVVRRPITVVHAGLGWLAFAMVTLGYAYLAHGHPMYGAEGAVTLFVIRQGVALARMALRFGVLAGQVELGRTRPQPPRRVEAKLDAKA